jgi:putative tricarboxylic transport membrane protein
VTRVSDRVAGAVFLALAAWIWWKAGSFRLAFGDPVGPSAFPRLVAAPMAFCALVLLVAPDAEPDWPRGGALLRQGAALATLLAYPALLAPLGFPLATAAAVAALARTLGAGWGAGLAAGAAMGLGLWALFDPLLGLPLPLLPGER